LKEYFLSGLSLGSGSLHAYQPTALDKAHTKQPNENVWVKKAKKRKGKKRKEG